MDSENDFKYSSEETIENLNKKKMGLGRTIFIAFVSSLIGATLAIGVCFNVPQVKERVIENDNTKTSKVSLSKISSENKTVVDVFAYSETAIAVANKALPSVAGITVNYQVSTFRGGKTQAEAVGSGIIISEDGYIVTNNHVISAESSSYYYTIEKAAEITVKLYNDETPYKATVVGTDEYTDIAILKIEKDNLTPATLGKSEDVQVGEVAFAIGNPVGMDYSVTSGIISAKDREVEVEGITYTAIQTDAAINSGNSGGALVNANGEVIGINTLKLSGTGIEGIGFAIPISSVTDIIEQLIEYKEVKRPYIGISGTSINSYTAQRYNLPEGIYIESVEKSSSAEQAGLKQGDIITKIEGKEVSSINELNKVKYNYNIGDTVTLTVYRDNKEQEIKVTLSETPKQN